MIDSRHSVVLFSITIAVAVLLPLKENFKKRRVDDFPLSYYPMFSAKRGEHYTLNYVVGYDSANTRYYVPYRYIGSGGFNQVRRQLNKKVRMNDTENVLDKTISRIKKKNRAPYNELVKFELARGKFNLTEYFQNVNKVPVEETILDITYISEP